MSTKKTYTREFKEQAVQLAEKNGKEREGVLSLLYQKIIY
jgi:transposase-like protein